MHNNRHRAKGVEELKQIYKNIIPIYVMPPTQERIKQNRNQNRLQRSVKQIKYAEKSMQMASNKRGIRKKQQMT